MSTGFLVMLLASAAGATYCVVTVVKHSAEYGRRKRILDEVRALLKRDKQRLTEYEDRVVVLEEDLPARRTRCERLTRWVALLRGQHAQLEMDQKPAKMNSEARDGLIRKQMLRAQRRSRKE